MGEINIIIKDASDLGKAVKIYSISLSAVGITTQEDANRLKKIIDALLPVINS